MRIGLPRLLLISAVLHAVLLSLLVWHFGLHHGRITAPADPLTDVTLTYTLQAESASDRLHAYTGHFQPDPNPDGTSAPPLPSPISAKGTTAAPPPSFALKNASNSHVRSPSESVLSPSSPPHVNSGEGLAFILDVSGSMYEPYEGTSRLALARQVMANRIRALRNGAPFCIIVYGERAERTGPLVLANDTTRDAAVNFINHDHDLGGGTNLPTGFSLAAELSVGAILLVTDGDLNMSEAELFPQVRRILGTAREGPALTIIAIAPRPDTDAKDILQDLAARQGGIYVLGQMGDVPDLLTSAKTGP